MVDFKSVHDEFRPRVLRYLAHLVGEAEAEDLTQAVMLKVSRGLPAFRGDSSVSTWIYRIATNTALDRLRGKKAPALAEVDLERDEDETPPEAITDSLEATAIREEMNACIRDFIGRLPESYRTVMVLSELEGFRNEEIAGVLGVSLDTVKIRLHRARRKLRADLESGCLFHRDGADGLACEPKPIPVKFGRRN